MWDKSATPSIRIWGKCINQEKIILDTAPTEPIDGICHIKIIEVA